MNTKTADMRERLLAQGIRPTYSRLKILEYLCDHHSHPTVDHIHHHVVKEIPTMSKTTVYNTLKSFIEKGIIAPVNITGTELRFDYTTEPHHHFLCEKCGSIIDVAIKCPNLQRGEIDGHCVKELHGYFKGLCARCK